MTASVLLLGGAGVFGSRIARLLARTGDAEILIAGRGADRAQALAAELRRQGASARAIIADRGRNLGDILQRERPALLIDASGPFQECDDSVPRLCIAHRVPYIDIADGRACVSGIGALDAAAIAAGIPVLSGASSVPCLSGAAVEALARDLDTLESIRTWISPGNRAPRGLSVVRAILAGAGRPLRWRQDGAPRTVHGWQDLHRIELPELGRRWVSACDVPDLELFPAKWPSLREATFHAGLELAGLHLGLWAGSWLVRWRLVRSLAPLSVAALAVAQALERFGTDRGAMRVEIVGRHGGRALRRSWTLIAEAGHGPWVPAAPAAALARQVTSGRVAPGARPCLGVLPLDAMLHELRHLEIRTRLEEKSL
jgi:Saccharopine dehydrogenase NADP binding domain